jgi:hypothetical protein
MMDEQWEFVERPGYFGRRRDEKMAAYDTLWGRGHWKICWLVQHHDGHLEENTFEEACKKYYERSYIEFLKKHPEHVDFICQFGECIDNDETNIESGLDYMKQESWATHIQDIAVRNALKALGRKFEGNRYKVLVIRSKDSAGYKFGPGNVPFYRPELIRHPSLAPSWASLDSVEDFWQSNKVIMRRVA